ncbi:type VII secretion protein EccE [Gordonia effusa]|nr:type VII secretion protein EccE [Gordonia effusa]
MSIRSGPARVLLAVEAVLATGLVIWSAIGDARGSYALLGCVAVGLLAGLRPVRNYFHTRWRRAQFDLRRVRRDPHDVVTRAFDVPLPNRSRRDGVTEQMGARWVDDTLITMLGIHADLTVPTTLTCSGVVPDYAGQTLTMCTIANCLNTFDISVDSVDLVSHGRRTAGPGHIARIYHATLGPLPAVADRVTFLVIRLRPADFADAVARRGGGSVGAVRAAVVTTRRITAALNDAGIAASILTARQITNATMFLTDGVPPGASDETWSQLIHDDTRTRTFAINPADLPKIAASSGWSHDALSTTLALRLRPGSQPGLCTGLLRVNEHPTSNRVLGESVSGLVPLPGRQFEALCATLPVASASWLDRSLAWAPLPTIGPLQIGGCGQLIGADGAGRGVAIALAAAPAVIVVGQQQCVWQVVSRAVATGMTVTISTDRRGYWDPLVTTVADHGALSFDGQPQAYQPSPHLHVVDEIPGMPIQFTDDTADMNVTLLYVFDDVTRAAQSSVRATIRLIHDQVSPGYIDLEVAGHRRRVSIVTTPEEWRMFGSRPATQRAPIRRSPLPISQLPAQREPTPERTSPLPLRPAR